MTNKEELWLLALADKQDVRAPVTRLYMLGGLEYQLWKDRSLHDLALQSILALTMGMDPEDFRRMIDAHFPLEVIP